MNIVGSGTKRKPGKEDAQSFSVATKVLSMKTVWYGGSESHTFNRLEDIALHWNAVTPILGCRISRVLESSKVTNAIFKYLIIISAQPYNFRP